MAAQSLDLAIQTLWSSYLLLKAQIASADAREQPKLTVAMNQAHSLLTDLLERNGSARHGCTARR